MFVGTAGLYLHRRPDLALAGVVAARRLVLSADGVATGDAYLPPALPATQETTLALRRIAAATGLLMADVGVSARHHVPADHDRTRRSPPGLRRREPRSLCRRSCCRGRRPALRGHPGISNNVGPSAHAAWKRNATGAAAAACHAALEVIDRAR